MFSVVVPDPVKFVG